MLTIGGNGVTAVDESAVGRLGHVGLQPVEAGSAVRSNALDKSLVGGDLAVADRQVDEGDEVGAVLLAREGNHRALGGDCVNACQP